MNIIIPKNRQVELNTYNLEGGKKPLNINYPIIVEKNFDKISPNKNSKIFICIYRICKSTKKKNYL